MRAITIHGPRNLRIEDRESPRAASPNDVRIQVRLAGICGTDRQIILGELPSRRGGVLGHEIVGTVVEAQGSPNCPAGSRVVINPTGWCGTCAPCTSGKTSLCIAKDQLEIGIALDGGWAEEVSVPNHLVHSLTGTDISDEAAILIEPLACVLSAARNIGLKGGESIVIIGGGPIGSLWGLFVEHVAAANAILIEQSAYRREYLRQLLLKTSVIGIANSAPKRGADIVIDTTGQGFLEAIMLVRDGGTVGLMGCQPHSTEIVAPFEITRRGLTVFGVIDYDHQLFRQAISLANALPMEKLVTHQVNLAEYSLAMRLLALEEGQEYGALKVAFRIHS